MRTRAFKNGNSQAVCVPAEIAFESMDMDLEITREGNKLIIQTVERSLGDILRNMTPLPDCIAKGRSVQKQADREAF